MDLFHRHAQHILQRRDAISRRFMCKAHDGLQMRAIVKMAATTGQRTSSPLGLVKRCKSVSKPNSRHYLKAGQPHTAEVAQPFQANAAQVDQHRSSSAGSLAIGKSRLPAESVRLPNGGAIFETRPPALPCCKCTAPKGVAASDRTGNLNRTETRSRTWIGSGRPGTDPALFPSRV
jgi:hypothetical protein